MPPSCLCPKLTWGADVASACCSLHDKGEPGSPCPSRPVLRIIGSLLLLLASGFFLSAWWCTLPCARVYIYIYFFFLYMFSALATLFKLRLAPRGCGSLSLQPAAGPSKRQSRGWSRGANLGSDFGCLPFFWIWFALHSFLFCDEPIIPLGHEVFVPTGAYRRREGMAEQIGKASGSGLKNLQRDLVQNALRMDPCVHELSLYYTLLY